MTLKERVEENIVLWLLGSLLTGFLSGIATYRTVQEVGGLEPVSKIAYKALEQRAGESEASTTRLQNELSKVKDQLDAARRQGGHTSVPPVIPAAKPADFPELRGLTVEMWFPETLASKAIEVKSKLQNFGMYVALRQSDSRLAEHGQVDYHVSKNETAALELAQVLKEYGFHTIKFYDDKSAKYDFGIDLRP